MSALNQFLIKTLVKSFYCHLRAIQTHPEPPGENTKIRTYNAFMKSSLKIFPLPHMPDVYANDGMTIQDTISGKKFKSNGKRWVYQ